MIEKVKNMIDILKVRDDDKEEGSVEKLQDDSTSKFLDSEDNKAIADLQMEQQL